MTDTERQLLDVLISICKSMKNPENWHGYGICFCIAERCETSDDRVNLKRTFRDIQKDWPEYSGDMTYPVPAFGCDDDGEDEEPPFFAQEAFENASDKEMWDEHDSPYAATRWRLLNFVIDRLERKRKEEAS